MTTRPPGNHTARHELIRGIGASPRPTHRGRRSAEAVKRRSRHGASFPRSIPPAGDSEGGKSLDESSTPLLFTSLGFTVFFINIQSINSPLKRAALAAELERLTPDILGLNETWLDSSVENLDIPGYELVSRRDRPSSRVGKLNHGGVALYRRRGGILVTHLEDSSIAERSWHVVHADVGGLLLGLWYRPPASSHAHIESFDSELERLGEGMIGSLVVGDVNVWHKCWLKHSPANTLEGERLHAICKEHGLKQLVQEPTRGPNLLDVVLSSLHGAVSAVVTPAVADHKGVIVTVNLPKPETHVIERTVWDYKGVKWAMLSSELASFDFKSAMYGLDVNDATLFFTAKVLEIARRHIPTRVLKEHKGTHPWLDERCRQAIVQKHLHAGRDGFEESCRACTEVLREQYGTYISKVRDEMKKLPRGSKKWWGLSKVLMDNASRRQ